MPLSEAVGFVASVCIILAKHRGKNWRREREGPRCTNRPNRKGSDRRMIFEIFGSEATGLCRMRLDPEDGMD